MTSRVRSDYDWRALQTVSTATLEALDVASIRGLNAEGGEGAFTPTANLTINGEIQQWRGTLSLSTNKSPGSVVLASKGLAKAAYGNNKFAPASALAGTCPNQIYMGSGTALGATTKQRYVQPERDYFGTRKLQSARAVLPLRVRDGMTLSLVRFDYVEEAHAAVPEIAARVRVVRVNASGLVEPIGGDSSYDEEGWAHFIYTVAPSAGGNFYNYVCNYNLVVDVENYMYFAEVIGEGGTNSKAVVWLSAMCPEGGSESDFE